MKGGMHIACCMSWACLALAACEQRAQSPIRGADAKEGRLLLEQYACGSCHTIPGVRNAVSRVGPPLKEFSRHVYIAGEVPNDPDTLIRFIQDPQDLVPGTAMPDLGVNEIHARHMAAYLYEAR